MYVMFDGPAENIPHNPHAVIVYINGHVNVLVPGGSPEEQVAEAHKRWPGARILTMSVEGIVPADAYDVERGDYTPEQVPELYRVAVEHGIWRPCFYGQLSGVMPQIKEQLNHVIQAREDVRLLVASWDDLTIIPAGFDGKQFTDHALGRDLDESVLLPTFFKTQVKPPAPTPDATWKATVAVDPDSRTWTIHAA